uniref:THO complex subunit 1 n=2 Tax=Odontella aurita TaxID=265563 RepID=A0A7S4N1P0_9STRA|mmetsp:Transcript_44336/g.135094  ORF Transcript_44336/g.135094 Transcript_44336/m.135094 type:complete len:1197 (+) Transcript_44336:204-3794(+)
MTAGSNVTHEDVGLPVGLPEPRERKLPTSSLSFPSSLSEPLRSLALAALPPSGKPVPPVPQRIDELEIAARAHLLELTGGLLRAGGDGGGDGEGAMDVDSCSENVGRSDEAMSALLTYLRDALDLCVHIVRLADTLDRCLPGHEDVPPCYRDVGKNVVVRKLPFLLLEDTLDTLPLSFIKTFWSLGPSAWMHDLCDPDTLFITGSRLALIRLCNKLLRKLSNRDRDAGFAGRVMMLLASVFPLSERSAVNVLGTFNVMNKTDFESEEEFDANRTTMLKADVSEEAGGGTEELLQEMAEKKPTVATIGGHGGPGGGGIDYPFYRKFWGAQEGFTDPNPMLPGRDGKFNPEKLERFVGDVRAVLAAFEGHPFPDDVMKQSRARWLSSRQKSVESVSTSISASGTSPSPMDSGAQSESGTALSSRHHKYLTNSQLLHLQLPDPEMRIHILTQLLIICSYLTSQIEAFLSIKSDDEKKGRIGTLLGDLIKLGERSEELLRTTPPHGTAHLRTVQWVLRERETVWLGWKRNKCQPKIERYKLPEASASTAADDQEAQKRKRRALMSGSLGSGGDQHQLDPTSLDATVNLYSFNIDVRKDLPEISRLLVSCIPSLESHLEDYVEALDPEAGIEETYHPRNDKAFSWRAMRLLAKDNIGRFEAVRRRDGDFENVVRDIWKEKGHDIPGDAPEGNPDPLKEEEESEENSKGKDEDAMGIDDASVGSPVSGKPDEPMEKDDEDREARLKEFAKVADELMDDMLQQQEEGEAEVKPSPSKDAASSQADKDPMKSDVVKEDISDGIDEPSRKRRAEDISSDKVEDKESKESGGEKDDSEKDSKRVKKEQSSHDKEVDSKTDSKLDAPKGKSGADEERARSTDKGSDNRRNDGGGPQVRDEKPHTESDKDDQDRNKSKRSGGTVGKGGPENKQGKSRDERRPRSPREDRKPEPRQQDRGSDRGRRGGSSDKGSSSERRDPRPNNARTGHDRDGGSGSATPAGRGPPERTWVPRIDPVKADSHEDHRGGGGGHRRGQAERRADPVKSEPRGEGRGEAPVLQPLGREGGGDAQGSSPKRRGSGPPLEIDVPTDRAKGSSRGGGGGKEPDRGGGGGGSGREPDRGGGGRELDHRGGGGGRDHDRGGGGREPDRGGGGREPDRGGGGREPDRSGGSSGRDRRGGGDRRPREDNFRNDRRRRGGGPPRRGRRG